MISATLGSGRARLPGLGLSTRGSGSEPMASSADTIAALLVWVFSGGLIPLSKGNEDMVLAGGAAILLLYAVANGAWRLGRIAGFFPMVFGLACWATARSVHLLDLSQWYPLVGQILKFAVIAAFLAGCRRPLDALVRAMVWICLLALAIFTVRQGVRIVTGQDIANLFSGFYQWTGLLPDRTIVLFNFDIPSEASRNSGPFREPGMFAANICIAILLSVSRFHHGARLSRTRNIGILILALISTQSTMGLSTIPLLLAIWYGAGDQARNMGRWALLSLVVGIGVYVWFSSGQSAKLEGYSAYLDAAGWTSAQLEGGWTSTRLGNAIVDFRAIEARPLLGYGFAESGRPVFWDRSIEQGFGNGLTGTFVKFGSLLAVFMLGLLAWGLKGLMQNGLGAILAVIVVGMLLIGQQLLTLPVIFVFLAGTAQGALVSRSPARARLRQSGRAGPVPWGHNRSGKGQTPPSPSVAPPSRPFTPGSAAPHYP